MTDGPVPLLARQPILDEQQQVIGYELLSRPAPAATEQWQKDHGDSATSEVITGAFAHIGIEEVTNGLPAYINFTRYWLENPPLLCGQAIVAELLEHLELSSDLVPHMQRLRQQKFQIALDDYVGDDIPDDILELVDIIKVDLIALESLNPIARRMEEYRDQNIIWLAEKVETREEFETCRQMGFTRFQGYFFARPDVMYGRKVSENKLTVLKLLKVLNDPDAEVDDVARTIQADPQLSYRLLHIVNSAAFGTSREITSINRAIMIIGFDRLRSWTNLLALGQLNDKPKVLQEQAVTRACLARQLAQHWQQVEPDTAFTVGLFSLLDAFVDVPLDVLCQKLHLSEEITLALTRHEGELGNLIQTILKLEHADWSSLDWSQLEEKGLNSDDISLAYLDALMDARDLIQALS